MGQICSFCGSGDEPKRPGAFDDASTADAHSQSQAALSYGQQASGASSPGAVDPGGPSSHASSSEAHPLGGPGGTGGAAGAGPTQGELDQMEEDRQRRMAQYRLEQVELARREAIVTSASRSMVPVGSQGGGMGGRGSMMGAGGGHHHHHHSHPPAYDPAYAAAAAQDILRSAAVTGGLVFRDDRATRAAWDASVAGTMPVPAPSAARGGGGREGSTKDVIDALGRGRWDGVR
ncbi:hypothetical protein ACHAWF_005757, partial [Thalassiosira exigua]